VGGAGRATALLSAIRSTPQGARIERAARTRYGSGTLESSGRFDLAFYEAQAGRPFGSLGAAVRHYCATGWRADLSPHPLYDPTVHLHDPQRRRESVRTPFEVFLRTCRSPRTRAHALFDGPIWLKANPAAAQHPQGAWGHFLDVAGHSSLLPLPPQTGSTPRVTYAALVENAFRHARIWSAQHRIADPDRLSDHFDTAAAAALARRIAGVAPPVGIDGAPVVSIITPVRNRPQQVLSAIASVLHQTLTDWELIVVDDGSTDDTADVVEALAATEPRIRVLRRPAGGVCAARNAGAEAARGRYLAWLDSDTTWEPDFLRLALTAMAHDGLRVAHAAQQFTDDEGRLRFRQFPGGVEHLSVGNFVDLNVLVAERSIVTEIGGFDEGLRRAVDYDLVLRLAAVTELGYLPIIGSVYADDLAGADRIGVRELRTWNYVVRERAFLNWDALVGGAPGRTPGLTSLLLSSRNSGAAVWASIHSVLDHTAEAVEVVVVDGASRLPDSLRTGQAELLDPARVRVLRTVVNLNSGVGHNVAFARSSGDRIVLLGAGIAVDDGWLAPLLAGLADPPVGDRPRWVATAPLLVTPRGLVESAGTVFAPGGSLPMPLLTGLLDTDARRLLAAHGGSLTLAAASGRVLAVRAADYAAVHGYDPLFVDGPDDADLCLRLGQHAGRGVGVLGASTVRTTPLPQQRPNAGGLRNRRLFTARWRSLLAAAEPPGSVALADLLADAGFDLLGFADDDEPDTPADAARVRPLLRWRSGSALRWTVDLTGLVDVPDSLATVRGAADQLVRALSDHGQVAAVRRPGTPIWPVEHDGVVVTVPGRRPAHPLPAAANVLWLPEGGFIPNAQEALGFDVVLTADPVLTGPLVRRVADASSRLAGRPTGGGPVVVVLDGPLIGFGPTVTAVDELVTAVRHASHGTLTAREL
jgi:glycosyltransferase involved in cell wall biosynthesis